MTNLFYKITNQIIMMSKKYLLFPDVAGQKSVRKVDLWDQNFNELAVKLEHCIKLNETFQELYHAVKEKLATQPKGKQFDFNESRIFSKLDQFCKRVQKLKDLFTTIPQFSKIASHNLEGLEPMIKTFFVMAEDLKKKNYDLLDFTFSNSTSMSANLIQVLLISSTQASTISITLSAHWLFFTSSIVQFKENLSREISAASTLISSTTLDRI